MSISNGLYTIQDQEKLIITTTVPFTGSSSQLDEIVEHIQHRMRIGEELCRMPDKLTYSRSYGIDGKDQYTITAEGVFLKRTYSNNPSSSALFSSGPLFTPKSVSFCRKGYVSFEKGEGFQRDDTMFPLSYYFVMPYCRKLKEETNFQIDGIHHWVNL